MTSSAGTRWKASTWPPFLRTSVDERRRPGVLEADHHRGLAGLERLAGDIRVFLAEHP